MLQLAGFCPCMHQTPQAEACATGPTPSEKHERTIHNCSDLGELPDLRGANRRRALLPRVRKNSTAAARRRLLRFFRPAAEIKTGPGSTRAAISLALLEAAPRSFRARPGRRAAAFTRPRFAIK